MKNKFLLLYSWFIFLILSLLPDQPLIMRFRGWLLSFGMKKCGKDFQVSSTVIIRGLQNLEVGNHVYLGPRTTMLCGDIIEFEDEILVGPHCIFASGNHTSNNSSFRFGKMKRLSIKVGYGSWIAGNCTITAGVVIGKNVLLAANSCITESADNGCLYAGCPAKKVKVFANENI